MRTMTNTDNSLLLTRSQVRVVKSLAPKRKKAPRIFGTEIIKAKSQTNFNRELDSSSENTLTRAYHRIRSRLNYA